MQSGAEHPLSKVKPYSSVTRLRRVCASSRCSFHVDFQRQTKDESWVLRRFAPHGAYCGLQEGPADAATAGAIATTRRERNTAYDADQLSVLVEETARLGRFRVLPSSVQSLLKPYLRCDASADLATRVLHQAYSTLYGSPEDNLKRLEPYAASLRRAGFDVNLYLYTADEMNQVIVARAESDHKRRMNALPQRMRTEFDPTGLVEAVEDKQYLAGWSVTGFPTTRRMLASGDVLRVFAGDFAFAKGAAEGNYAFVVAYDANSHIVPVSAMWTAEEECKKTWELLVAVWKSNFMCDRPSFQRLGLLDGVGGLSR